MMKNVKSVRILTLVVLVLLLSCNNSPKESDKDANVNKDEVQVQKDSTNAHQHGAHLAMTAYQCPMECEGDKTYPEPGTCPECHMNLMEVTIPSDTDATEE